MAEMGHWFVVSGFTCSNFRTWGKRMKLDAIFSFGTAIVADAVTLFGVIDPAIAGILKEFATIMALLGTALHLDGK